jgi:hypothetical protein
MSTHDAEYFRRRRGALRIPARELFSAPKFPPQAIEQQLLEQLPWPRNLFGELASIAELMAESEHGGQNADGICSWECREEHKHDVPRAPRNPYDRGFDLSYLGSEVLQEQMEPGAEAETGR